jgi:hypothetical protein
MVEQPHAEGRHVYLFIRTKADHPSGPAPDSNGTSSSSSSFSLSTARNHHDAPGPPVPVGATAALIAPMGQPVVVCSMLALPVIAGQQYTLKNLRPDMNVISGREAPVFGFVDAKSLVTEASTGHASFDWTSTAINSVMVMRCITRCVWFRSAACAHKTLIDRMTVREKAWSRHSIISCSTEVMEREVQRRRQRQRLPTMRWVASANTDTAMTSGCCCSEATGFQTQPRSGCIRLFQFPVPPRKVQMHLC